MKQNIFELLPQELTELFVQKGIPGFRSRQLLNWVYDNRQINLAEMTNIPQKTRDEIDQLISFDLPQTQKIQRSTDGTRKFLLKLEDKNLIETVHIPGSKKNTQCVSSQVGCSRQCVFCATARTGLKRNLTAAEIVGQVYLLLADIHPEKLTNIVFMGMGEPLDNLDNVIKAIRVLQDDSCLKFSPRRITISTCGLIKGIQRLSDSKLKVKLAVSLNSAIEAKREQLMPISRQNSLPELKKALLDFRRNSPFRITFEYVMIKDFNMDRSDVKAIISYIGDISCKLNLIKWNEVPNLPYKSPFDKEIEEFRSKLQNLSSAVTFRQSRGADIAAACGQLAAEGV
jgi:23S rRNA (adenine2503-C2)-methyltransferase